MCCTLSCDAPIPRRPSLHDLQHTSCGCTRDCASNIPADNLSTSLCMKPTEAGTLQTVKPLSGPLQSSLLRLQLQSSYLLRASDASPCHTTVDLTHLSQKDHCCSCVSATHISSCFHEHLLHMFWPDRTWQAGPAQAKSREHPRQHAAEGRCLRTM